MTSLININGDIRDASSLDLPDRKFRDAWVFNGNAVELDVNKLNVIMRRLVNEERDRRIVQGQSVDVSGVGVFTMDTRNEADFRNLNGLALKGTLLMIAADAVTTTEVRDSADQSHYLTGAQLISMAEQVAAKVSAIYAASWALKAMDPIPSDYADDSYWT